jgi:photosystem II stability/assembly factor-like uncharacterized protein
MKRLGLRHLLIAALAWGALGGCAEEQTTIELQSVPMPEGGSVPTVAVLDGAERLDVVVPTSMGLFIHRNDTGAWRRLEPTWPEDLPASHAEPLRALASSDSYNGASRAEGFVARGSQLWMVVGANDPQPSSLMVSEDAGLTWRLVAVPEPNAPEPDDEPSADDEQAASTDNAPDDAAHPPSGRARRQRRHGHLRLVDRGGEGFFLLDGTRLWQLNAGPDEAIDDQSWSPISLEGIDWDRTPGETSLPTMLRHYLPATDERPFELMTVLRDRLFVYRRDSNQAEWLPIVSMATTDRALMASGDGGILMLTPRGLLRSGDGAETFEPVTMRNLPRPEAEATALEVLPAADDEDASVLLAFSDGSIHRSVDDAHTFQQVRSPDTDHRVVVDFSHSPIRGRLWAGTSGGGVLRSLDRGQSWHQINEELRATRAYDLGIDDNEGLLLGSDAGLFRLVGAAGDGHWQMLHDQPTTTIHLEERSGAIISGTTTGAIVRLEPNGKSTAAEAAPVEQEDTIVYRPMRFQGTQLARRAIAAIEARPDSQHVFAWSIEEGPLTSLDGGISWTRLKLNPAFRSALEGSYLSGFTADYDERMYLVTHALDGATPTQLWRSYNNGQTWHAVSSFASNGRRDPIFTNRSADYSPEVLLMAHSDRFAQSLDGGNSWRDIAGPWSGGRVLAYELDGRTHLLAVDRRHATHLYRVRHISQERPDITSYTLSWPEDVRAQRTEIRGLALNGEHVYVRTPNGLFSGSLPDGQQNLPDGLAIIVMITSTLGLTAVGFGVLRWKGT